MRERVRGDIADPRAGRRCPRCPSGIAAGQRGFFSPHAGESSRRHIGLSMGIQGTEVAKESSDIIILDDNFASVVKVLVVNLDSKVKSREVVCWGRSVYANIQKFIQFQLTVNVAALITNVIAAVSSGNVPLNAVQVGYFSVSCI
ncbi:hypothetical protein GW17_00004029 [Ensete ventricosum]|nr:hypothetical protein GW17_00004029 [Ensete ventricosum]